MREIIGICGFIGSGKDTVADYLVTEYGFQRDSFAQTLKEVLCSIFGWEMSMMSGLTPEARAARNVVDEWWAKRLGIPHFTPRWAMQNFGTEVCRNHFHQDIWIATLERRLLKRTTSVVITDCRFKNEVAAVKNAGGRLIEVVRGNSPEWLNDGIKAANGDTDAITRMDALSVHASEWAWLSTEFDSTLINNHTIESLHRLTDSFFSSMGYRHSQ